MLYIDKYKKDDGFYDEHGCFYEDAESFIQNAIFNFCSCGQSFENLEYVRDGLRHIQKLGITDNPDWDDWKAKAIEIFGNEKAQYFFYYWADKMGFTEHGGSVPGWLTQKGGELLQDLIQICTE